jgi:hypothetical protein
LCRYPLLLVAAQLCFAAHTSAQQDSPTNISLLQELDGDQPAILPQNDAEF